MIPGSRSFSDLDRQYRRGLVLGLSLAEVFLILLFLLLLATIGYSVIVEEEMDEVRAMNDRLSDERAAANTRADAAEGERDALAEKLARAEKALGNIIESEEPLDLIVGLQEEIDELEAQVDQLAPDAELGRQIRESANESGIISSELPEIIAGAAQARRKIEELQAQLEDAQKEIDKLTSRFDALAKDKGQHPPCWYTIVKRPDGTPRERPEYIFDVKISDDSVFVKDIPAPTPEYALEKPSLPFDRNSLNKNLSFGEFVKSFKPLKDAGENGKVRGYRCKFFVKVWNSTTTLEKYQHAFETVVEAVFFTFRVRNDPWPY